MPMQRVAALSLLLCALWIPAPAQQPRAHRNYDDEKSAQAQQYIAAGRFADAEPLVRELLKDHEDMAALWREFGYVEAQLNRVDEAASAYRRAFALEPDFESAVNLSQLLLESPEKGAFAEATATLRRAEALTSDAAARDDLSQLWLRAARLAQRRQASEEARACAQESLRLAPNAEQRFAEAAETLLAAGDANGAEELARRRLAKKPDDVDCLELLARALLSKRDAAGASETLRRLSALRPNDAATRLLRARLLMADNKTEEAVVEYESLTADASMTSAVAAEYLTALMKLNRAAQAEAFAQKHLAGADPATTIAERELYARALLQQLKYEASLREYLTLVHLQPSAPEPLGQAALAANEAHRPQLCLQLLEARAKLTEDNAATSYLRAISFDALGDAKQASLWYRKFLALDRGEASHSQMRFQADHRLIAIDPAYREQRRRESK